MSPPSAREDAIPPPVFRCVPSLCLPAGSLYLSSGSLGKTTGPENNGRKSTYIPLCRNRAVCFFQNNTVEVVACFIRNNNKIHDKIGNPHQACTPRRAHRSIAGVGNFLGLALCMKPDIVLFLAAPLGRYFPCHFRSCFGVWGQQRRGMWTQISGRLVVDVIL